MTKQKNNIRLKLKVDLYFKFDFYRKIMGGLTMEILMQSENLLLGVNLDSKKSGESEKNKKNSVKHPIGINLVNLNI